MARPDIPPTLEEVWARYGPRIELVARQALGPDEDAVRTASVRVITEAAALIQVRPDLLGNVGTASWLIGLTSKVCAALRPEDVAPGAAKVPMPDAIPARLLDSFRLQASVARSDEMFRRTLDAEDERRTGPRHAVLWLAGLARRVREAASECGSQVRGLAQRCPSVSNSSAPGLSGVPAAIASSGLTETLAAMAAAVVLTLGGSPGHGQPSAPQEARRLTSPAAHSRLAPPESLAAPRSGTGWQGPLVVAAPEMEPLSDVGTLGERDDDRSADRPVAPVAPAAAPHVSTETAGGHDEPVERREYDPGEYEYRSVVSSVTVDIDNGGENDVSLATPYAGIGCGPPDERGIVTGPACAATEDSDGAVLPA